MLRGRRKPDLNDSATALAPSPRFANPGPCEVHPVIAHLVSLLDRATGSLGRARLTPVARRPIFTPDRRLRVFVSSTLRELALERMAASEAISSLHLAPVLFEQGARPHAPRDLYAAYVRQCEVFVGIYWQSYGWIAPGEEISGLEDEYELAQGKPMLLYIKEPALDREERLSALIRRIEEEAGPAYRTFSTVEELRQLVSDDLALLLTERFHASVDGPEQRSALPARTTSFVGRDEELEDLLRLAERGDVRLVTLTGPGGIGKTRLAVEAARQLAPRFPDGAAYVALDRLTDPELVPAAIADAVGLPSLGPDQEACLGTPPSRAAAAPRPRQLRARACRRSTRHPAARGLRASGGARDEPRAAAVAG